MTAFPSFLPSFLPRPMNFTCEIASMRLHLSPSSASSSVSAAAAAAAPQQSRLLCKEEKKLCMLKSCFRGRDVSFFLRGSLSGS